MMVLNFHPRVSYLWKTAHTLLTLTDINKLLKPLTVTYIIVYDKVMKNKSMGSGPKITWI